MEITWNELLTSDQDNRIKILTTIYAEFREFKNYQDLLKKASLERASENLKTEITENNGTAELEIVHY